MDVKTGTVKFFSDKGYGFITPDNGEDLFFHSTGIQDGSRDINHGQRVEFEIGSNEKGAIAIAIKKLEL